jgi:hypothetical protein
MKQLIRPLIAALTLLLASALPAQALRCNGRVIDTDMGKPEVLHNCGEPTWVDRREEERIVRHCYRGDPSPDFHQEYHEYRYQRDGQWYTGCKIFVTIEEWFYNFGPNRLTQTLIFENNRLVRIETGRYGY